VILQAERNLYDAAILNMEDLDCELCNPQPISKDDDDDDRDDDRDRDRDRDRA
jgi:hypothetical protein